MRIHSYGVAVAALLIPMAMAAPPATAPSAPYVGTFVYRYPGFVVRAEMRDASRLKWTILEGGPVGKSAEEKVDRREIAPGIYFVAWTEADGTVVSQVTDFNTMRVISTLVAGGQRSLHEGTITRVVE